jgi:hypothetical protein
MIFRKNKSKSDLIKELDNKVLELNSKYKDIIDSYCKIGYFIFILKGFKRDGNDIIINYKNEFNGCVKSISLEIFEVKYNYNCDDFNILRNNFILFRNDMERLGLIINSNNNYKI